MGRPVPWALGLLLSLLILAEAGRNFRLLKQQVLRAREVQAMKETVSRRRLLRPAPWRSPSEGALRQPLDHFDRQQGQTFNQRFWINEEFWHRLAGPVFLYIGGESSLSQFSVLAGHHMEMAQKYGALAVALEHRFYGASINPDGLQDASLRFLSSQQALADLASFHLFVTQKYNLTRNNTWICFGGSYPGSLAAWFRLKFPHLVFAAVASSAPVRAQLDFTSYNQVVAASLSDPVVGGSAQCREAVAQAFSALDQRLHAGRLAELGKDFRSCGPLTEPDDRGELASNLADIFMGAVQYNNEGFQGGTVAKLCSIMTDTGLGSPYQKLIAVNNGFLESMALPCMENSHQRALAELRRANLTLSGVGERQWYFQTCTEFGYYQTCEDTTCPFSRLLTLSAQLDLCSQVFGIGPERVGEAVTFTNEYYGADHPKASRILFVNGDIDPWHALSVLKNQSRSELAILINGTSHCANMNPSRPSDPLPLVLARERIDYHVGDWLSLARKAPLAP
ncbi:thymus-specific serine protease [Terrapene carolina triunguis]|uniref:Serine protease 16 n=1 Tax=Terrapene triunguis TaxID=2587831 RepID=A0A674I7X9_9SAUR|nr:thymus-specific serine protease [Terrapene carolina triunguis]